MNLIVLFLRIALPPTLVEALHQLADDNDLLEIRTTVYERICEIVEEDTPLDLPTGESFDLEWSEGTERYKEYTRDDVLNALGIPDGRMPSFNAFLDPKGEKTYWRDRGWFEDDANVKLPCNPRWHQLIGMLALLDSAFNGKNILLMDEVGLGKTMQVAGVVALVTYFREFYAEKKDFPGAFSEFHHSAAGLITNTLKYRRREEMAWRRRQYP